MCTLVLLRRPDHDWPLIVAANRDEMKDRPWRPPARWWEDRPEVVAGLDELAGGTWMGLNDQGVTAAILNRIGTLGPAPGKRSRGELVLEALDHADAVDAVQALADLDAGAYRPFNMVVADNRDAYWIRADGTRVSVHPIAEGLHMISAHDLNDRAGPRIDAYLDRFRAAAVPRPEAGEWTEWAALMADPGGEGRGGEEPPAMCFTRPNGFGTVSSSLIALPAMGAEAEPVWRFAAGRPDAAPFEVVAF